MLNMRLTQGIFQLRLVSFAQCVVMIRIGHNQLWYIHRLAWLGEGFDELIVVFKSER